MEDNNNPKKKPLNAYLKFSAIAFQMGIIIAGGTFLGVWLDKKFPNEFSGFTIVGSLLAVFIALYIVIKQLQQINKDKS
ncbi:AtpZ/AtpI family protein [Flavobacterium sp. '19STA2R22 D10 B1']|uniref:AtpZ/AtpI family protein n=1 Tax=Flavobacterium aerium TaxID=3037261 RepID=UPI00278C1405|nr:AtpZ/AtpI family protein [Flavobacterium sp. '19STA2R22 D10 B1']